MPDAVSMHYAPVSRPRRSRDTIAFVLVALVPFIGLAAAMTQWVANPLKFNPRSVLRVVGTRPVNGARNFLPNGFVAADVHLPNKGKGVDAKSISAETVKLYRTKDHAPVAAVVNTSGAGDAVVLQPATTLEAQTEYTFEVTSGLKDMAGASFAPYTTSFTTAAGATTSDYPVAFDKVPLGQ